MFTIHKSNRSENLVESLTTLLSHDPPSPFESEVIVVQGEGMHRWLSMELTRQMAVWAHPAFPYPRRIIEQAFDAILGPPPEAAKAWEPEALRWVIARLLPDFASHPSFDQVNNYLKDSKLKDSKLQDDASSRKLIDLSERIAGLFDRYVAYRPEIVLRWEANQQEQSSDPTHLWQAELWRAVHAELGPHHLAARARDFADAIENYSGPLVDFPKRLSIFGISSLAPIYLRVLGALSDKVDIHLFLLSPSQEYWADIRTKKQILKASPAHNDLVSHDAHLDEGHPLLASMGKLGREFQGLLEEITQYQEGDELYLDPGDDTLLYKLQSDILNLQNPEDASSAKYDLASDDRSVQIHSCHSPLREVEVLRDQLLWLFDNDNNLNPEDVIVMMPRIADYAPLIEAVFQSSTIPYRVADRFAGVDIYNNALLAVIEILNGRFGLSEVMDLLSHRPIRDRFAISIEDIPTLSTWARQSGVRWGVDASHREAQGQPKDHTNTWRFGLDRLLTGFAMGKHDALWQEVLPATEGAHAESHLLNALIEFTDALFLLRKTVQTERSFADWQQPLELIIDKMLLPEDDAGQHLQLRQKIHKSLQPAAAGRFDTPLSIDIIRRHLQESLDDQGGARGFLSRGVTFCEMVPMRTIPFKVVALMGLSDGAYPRSEQKLGFDIMATQPLPGDRSGRDDDRYLILEALLAARQNFIITYVGQSIRDNAELPPSVLIADLIDTIDATSSDAATFSDAATSSDRNSQPAHKTLFTTHPLQPFSPRYFDSSGSQKLFSYSQQFHQAALSLTGNKEPPALLLTSELKRADSPPEAVSLFELSRFFDNPCRHLLQNELDIHLDNESSTLNDREPLELDPLENYSLGTDTLNKHLAGADFTEINKLLPATGHLPTGKLGQLKLDEVQDLVEQISQRHHEVAAGVLPHDPLAFEHQPEDSSIMLTGTLRDLRPKGLILSRYGSLTGKYLMRAWLQHLILNILKPDGIEPVTTFFGKNKGVVDAIRFKSEPNANEILHSLFKVYNEGQNKKLPLFPNASASAGESLSKHPNDEDKASGAAAKSFSPTQYNAGRNDLGDPYIARLWGDDDPPFMSDSAAYESFMSHAKDVYTPLYNALEKI